MFTKKMFWKGPYNILEPLYTYPLHKNKDIVTYYVNIKSLKNWQITFFKSNALCNNTCYHNQLYKWKIDVILS